MTRTNRLLQILKFLSAGSIGIFLYYLILYVLTDIVGIWYMISAVAASTINYGSNFVLQKFWAFENTDTKNIYQQATYYALLTASLFMANLILLYILVEYIRLHYLVAQVVVTGILTAISYAISQRIFTHSSRL